MKLIAALSLLLIPATHGGLDPLQGKTTINEQEHLEAAQRDYAPFIELHAPAYKQPVRK